MANEKLQLFPTKNDPYLMNSSKLLYHLDRIEKWRAGERVPPILIDIGATKACNIKCRFCYGVFQDLNQKTVIPPKVLVNLFYDAPRLGIKALVLTGDGEPTLNPGMWDALVIGKRGGLDIGVATNLVAVDVAKMDVMLDTCVWVRVCIAAANRKSYKFMHGQDYFDKVIQNVQTMMLHRSWNRNQTTIGLQMVLIPDCLDQVISLSKLAIDLGVDYFVIKQFSDPGVNWWNPGDKTIPCRGFNPDEFVKEAIPILVKAEGMSNDQTKIIVKWSLITRKNKRAFPKCIDCPFIFQISGDSTCAPCGYLFGDRRYLYGDLKKQSIGEIINSDHYWWLIDFMAKKFDVFKECQGSCRHSQTNVFMNDYIKRPEYYQELAKNLPPIKHKNFI